MAKALYKADITAGALKLPESRIVADLLLSHVSNEGWKDAIVHHNILQARSLSTARRLSQLIRHRLETMKPELWRLVRDGTGTVAAHAVMACSVKHSPLLGDFMSISVAEQYRLFSPKLSTKVFAEFLEGCHARDPLMPIWSDSTRNRLRSSVFQMLAQSGYIENTRNLKLQNVHVADQVLLYLKDHKEDYVLRCMKVSP